MAGTPVIDTADPAHAAVVERLERDEIAWIVSVRPDGAPHAVPVWFLWHESAFLVFSKDDRKVENLRREPRVTLHLNSDEHGGQVVILEGTGEVLDEPSGDVLAGPAGPAYLDKYRRGIEGLGLTPETMAAEYRTTIRVTPTKLRAW